MLPDVTCLRCTALAGRSEPAPPSRPPVSPQAALPRDAGDRRRPWHASRRAVRIRGPDRRAAGANSSLLRWSRRLLGASTLAFSGAWFRAQRYTETFPAAGCRVVSRNRTGNRARFLAERLRRPGDVGVGAGSLSAEGPGRSRTGQRRRVTCSARLRQRAKARGHLRGRFMRETASGRT